MNPQVRLFIPTAMASKLAYSTVQHRRGKREEGEEPVSKHQILPGDGRWTGRRGVGRLNPRRENKILGKNGDRGGGKNEKVAIRRTIFARKRRRRGRAERRRLQQRTEDRSCHAQRPDDGGGWDTRSWTGAGCFECVRSTGLPHHRFAGNPPQRTVGLQQSAFSPACYLVYSSGECGGENYGKKGQGGVGLAV